MDKIIFFHNRILQYDIVLFCVYKRADRVTLLEFQFLLSGVKLGHFSDKAYVDWIHSAHEALYPLAGFVNMMITFRPP